MSDGMVRGLSPGNMQPVTIDIEPTNTPSINIDR